MVQNDSSQDGRLRNSWTATYELVTPCFSKGAIESRVEVRPPSLKGTLRFWWRALAWARCHGDLKQIREEEAATFGSESPVGDTAAGQGILKLRVVQEKPLTTIAKGKCLPDGSPGLDYLAGLGLVSYSREKGAMLLTRPALASGTRFQASGLVRRENAPDIANALVLLGLLGGLGARTRRGFGSLCLRELEFPKFEWSPPDNLDGFVESLREVLRPALESAIGQPPYTALWSASRLIVIAGHDKESCASLLGRVGNEFIHERSYGRSVGTTRIDATGQTAEMNYKEDHGMMQNAAEGNWETITSAPERAVFGLPHNYSFSGGRRVGVKPRSGFSGRRASPLFLHAHRVGETPVVVAAFLPAAFLPHGEKISISSNRQEKMVDPGSGPDFWAPIPRFLTRLLHDNSRESKKRLFSRVHEIAIQEAEEE